MKKLVLALAGGVALFVGGGSAAAAGSAPVVETFPVGFVLTSDTCPNLPAGTVITGTGSGTSITSVRSKDSGVTTVANITHDFGSATDQDGNVYVFSYSNHFSASNTGANPAWFSGVMTDSFSLAGSGPAKLNNGFVATFQTDFSSFSFDPISAHGDPIAFPDGAAQCDPL